MGVLGGWGIGGKTGTPLFSPITPLLHHPNTGVTNRQNFLSLDFSHTL